MVEFTHNTLPYPPQMKNGGSSPAHLSSSSLSDSSWWLQFKWSQPPPRATDLDRILATIGGINAHINAHFDDINARFDGCFDALDARLQAFESLGEDQR